MADPNSKRKFKCSQCPSSFNLENNFMLHKASHLTSNVCPGKQDVAGRHNSILEPRRIDFKLLHVHFLNISLTPAGTLVDLAGTNFYKVLINRARLISRFVRLVSLHFCSLMARPNLRLGRIFPVF
jgi:hypothetical protein